jgi:hypothetical protein
MLTKRLPYAAPNANVMLAKHAYAPIPELGEEVPPQVAYVVRKLLAKSPDQRFATVGDVRDALEAAVAGTLVMETSSSSEALLDTGHEHHVSAALSARNEISEETRSANVAVAATRRAMPVMTSAPSTDVEIAKANAPRRRMALAIVAVAVAGAVGAAVAAMMSQPRDREAPPAASPAEVTEPAITPDASPARPLLVVDAAPAEDLAVEAIDAEAKVTDTSKPPRGDRTSSRDRRREEKERDAREKAAREKAARDAAAKVSRPDAGVPDKPKKKPDAGGFIQLGDDD